MNRTGVKVEKPGPGGVKVEHTTRSDTWLYLVPVISKPTPRARPCNLCLVTHPCKTTHLHLYNGTAIVSQGVLADLRRAGLPDLKISNEVKKPPPLEVGGKHGREAQNQRNGRILVYARPASTARSG